MKRKYIKLPPIPTPPFTINAPVVVEADPVNALTVRVVSKVLAPVNVWLSVETKPVEPAPAIGILNV